MTTMSPFDNEYPQSIEKSRKKKAKKKRPSSECYIAEPTTDINDGANNATLISSDMGEPTMEEKLASLDLKDPSLISSTVQEKPQNVPLPSADSVGVLLQQALHVDDRALLLECFNTQDKKVIRNSVALLNPSNVLKLLYFIISMIQSRGTIVACVGPWLSNLILEHSSVLMSQESTLQALNSLYQIIESRTSNFAAALKLSTCLDLLEVSHNAEAEESMSQHVVYEDQDASSEESTDAMETDDEEVDED